MDPKKGSKRGRKPENGTYVAVYDLQAVMPIPKGQISSFYYKSKINCFNVKRL